LLKFYEFTQIYRFLDAYKNNSIDIWGLSVQNEPALGYLPDHPFNSLAFVPDLERDFIIKNLGPTLEANGYGKEKLNLMISDDQRPRVDRTLFNGTAHNPSVYDWANAIFGNSSAGKYVSGVAFHWYFSTPNDTNVLDQTWYEYGSDYFILSTEACNGFLDNLVNLGDWRRAENYSFDIIEVYI
jgi:glucosylceramidase